MEQLDCTYAKNQLSLDRLKTAYDQKLRYSMLHIPPELGRKPPDSLRRTASVGVIYCLIADPEKENRGVDSQRIGGDFMQICFSISSGDVTELPKSLGEAKSWTRSLIIKALIPEGFFAMLDMLEEVQDSKTCSQIAARDSVMRANPFHGHGCSKATYGAICLNKPPQKVESSILKDFSPRHFRMHAAKIEPLWSTTKVADYAFASTVPIPGETFSEGSWLRWTLKQVRPYGTFGAPCTVD
ncbi:uncharacterized protein BT62DRAFT_921626 [Guyanagaster necrorhizus]|uniref:Uncharacterized protein n=1 Tax=Guyanagaster necrorhizus TaxID=856835 RepID=A0A9P7VNQ9_9AGAR|nr:uncharacterized protein BT62DRAFT_921626 [Guyanagaster necrorhizus MCA 3950]KAG7444002.1 hypothetical protein BT62DRAFT_921626 [Guyanagaster necrorhizus MCA 3950]